MVRSAYTAAAQSGAAACWGHCGAEEEEDKTTIVASSGTIRIAAPQRTRAVCVDGTCASLRQRGRLDATAATILYLSTEGGDEADARSDFTCACAPKLYPAAEITRTRRRNGTLLGLTTPAMNM